MLRELLMHVVSTLDPTTIPAIRTVAYTGRARDRWHPRDDLLLGLPLAIEGLGIHIACSDNRIDILISTQPVSENKCIQPQSARRSRRWWDKWIENRRWRSSLLLEPA